MDLLSYASVAQRHYDNAYFTSLGNFMVNTTELQQKRNRELIYKNQNPDGSFKRMVEEAINDALKHVER